MRTRTPNTYAVRACARFVLVSNHAQNFLVEHHHILHVEPGVLHGALEHGRAIDEFLLGELVYIADAHVQSFALAFVRLALLARTSAIVRFAD